MTRFLQLIALSIAALLLAAPAALAGAIMPESGGSPNADSVHSLYEIVFYICIFVFLTFQVALFYMLAKYRKGKSKSEPPQIHGNPSLELSKGVGLLVLVTVIAIIAFLKMDDIQNLPNGQSLPGPQQTSAGAPPEAKSGNPKLLTVEVSGSQFLWKYTYPNGSFSYQELVVPANKTVILKVSTVDVGHSWWVPALGGKKDALPGFTQYTWFKAPKPAVYDGHSALFSGTNFATMTARVKVVTEPAFQLFLQQNKTNLERAQKTLDELKPHFEKKLG